MLHEIGHIQTTAEDQLRRLHSSLEKAGRLQRIGCVSRNNFNRLINTTNLFGIAVGGAVSLLDALQLLREHALERNGLNKLAQAGSRVETRLLHTLMAHTLAQLGADHLAHFFDDLSAHLLERALHLVGQHDGWYGQGGGKLTKERLSAIARAWRES